MSVSFNLFDVMYISMSVCYYLWFSEEFKANSAYPWYILFVGVGFVRFVLGCDFSLYRLVVFLMWEL